MSIDVKKSIGALGIGLGGAGIGATLGYIAGKRSNSKKKRSRRVKNKASRKRRAHNSRRRKKHHYTSHRRIHKTKTGQPYIILPSGKARFISKKSARISKKRIGGRY